MPLKNHGKDLSVGRRLLPAVLQAVDRVRQRHCGELQASGEGGGRAAMRLYYVRYIHT